MHKTFKSIISILQHNCGPKWPESFAKFETPTVSTVYECYLSLKIGCMFVKYIYCLLPHMKRNALRCCVALFMVAHLSSLNSMLVTHKVAKASI